MRGRGGEACRLRRSQTWLGHAGCGVALDPVRAEWMLPTKVRKAAEVGVGGDHGAAVLHGDGRVLGISDQLPAGAGGAAQSFEDSQVIGARAHDARR